MQGIKVVVVKVVVLCIVFLHTSCTHDRNRQSRTVYEAEVDGFYTEFLFSEDNVVRMTRYIGVDDDGQNYYRYNIVNNDEPTLSITVVDTTFGVAQYFTGSSVKAVLSRNGKSYRNVDIASDNCLPGAYFQIVKCDNDEMIANFEFRMVQIQEVLQPTNDTIVISSGRIETKIDCFNY